MELKDGKLKLKIVSRSEWGALPSAGKIPELEIPITNVIMTKTGTETCANQEECSEQMRKLQKFHMRQGQGDIPYNFVISPDTIVFEGRGWNQTVPTPPARPELLNKALVIAHMGDFPEQDPRWRWQVRATFELIDKAIMDKTVDWEFKFMEIGPWINYDDTQQGMYRSMSDLIEHGVYGIKTIVEEFDLRAIPCWHDYRNNGFEMFYKNPEQRSPDLG